MYLSAQSISLKNVLLWDTMSNNSNISLCSTHTTIYGNWLQVTFNIERKARNSEAMFHLLLLIPLIQCGQVTWGSLWSKHLLPLLIFFLLQWSKYHKDKYIKDDEYAIMVWMLQMCSCNSLAKLTHKWMFRVLLQLSFWFCFVLWFC